MIKRNAHTGVQSSPKPHLRFTGTQLSLVALVQVEASLSESSLQQHERLPHTRRVEDLVPWPADHGRLVALFGGQQREDVLQQDRRQLSPKILLLFLFIFVLHFFHLLSEHGLTSPWSPRQGRCLGTVGRLRLGRRGLGVEWGQVECW